MKKFNFDEFLYFISLILINSGLIYMLINNNMSFYIGTKMVRYMYLAVVLITIIAICQIRNVFSNKSSYSLKLKIFPILIAIVIAGMSFTEQKSFKHDILNEYILNGETEDNLINHDHHGHDNKENDFSKYEGLDEIDINEDNIFILNDINKRPEVYLNKKIGLKGFVCKEEKRLEKNIFVIGRIVMKCCAADSDVVGILAQYEDEGNSIDENQWVEVRGTINYTTINDDDGVSHRVPIIKVTSLKNCKKENQS